MTAFEETGSPGLRTVDARVEDGPAPGVWTVTFQSQPLPGTLAAFAGTLTASRLDIVSAVIRLADPDTVLDAFDVVPIDGGVLKPSDAEWLARLASAVLNGGHDVSADIRELRRGFRVKPGIVPIVETQTDSAITTGIRVVAADRPGLLYDLASTIAKHGLRTRALSVLTHSGRVHDTFRVIDSAGGPPKQLEAVRGELLRVCSE